MKNRERGRKGFKISKDVQTYATKNFEEACGAIEFPEV